jgi:hypothetical protein
MTLVKQEFFAALTASGIPEIPGDFSVAPVAQLIPLKTLLEIDNFIRIFDRVTTDVCKPALQTIFADGCNPIRSFAARSVRRETRLL